MAEYQTIHLELSDGVGTLTLSRPEKLNAQNRLMWSELRQLGAELAAMSNCAA